MCELLDALASKGRLVGFDITEVSPPYDHNIATSLLASYLGLRFLESIYTYRAQGSAKGALRSSEIAVSALPRH